MKPFLYSTLLIALFSSCMNSNQNDKNLSSIINKALEETNTRFEGKNQMMYSMLERAKMNDEKAVGPIYTKAMTMKKESTELYTYIQKEKEEVTGSKISEDKIPMDELKDKMGKYYQDMFAFVPENELSVFKANYPSQDFSSPSLTILTKFQNDVLSMENDLVTLFSKQISMDELRFDELNVLVIPQATSIHSGEKYEASIYLAALNSISNPEIILGDVDPVTGEIIGNGDAKSVIVEGGVGKYEVAGREPGTYTVSGVVKMKKRDGTYNEFPFKTQYQVVK